MYEERMKTSFVHILKNEVITTITHALCGEEETSVKHHIEKIKNSKSLPHFSIISIPT